MSMKPLNKFLFFLIIPLIFCAISSCNNDSVLTNRIKKLYNEREISFDKDVEICVVLPEVGCGGCIASGVFFILNNKAYFSSNQKKNQIVFTAIDSKKMLKREMEITHFDELNCIVDTTNKYLPKGNNKIYPLVLRLKNGQIEDAVLQSPESNAFENLNLN